MSINQLGVIGLGTMGANLARNAARNGAKVAVFNRTTEVMHDFVKEYGKEGMIVPCKTYEELFRSLDEPRALLLMVKAGPAVDAVIEDFLPHLKEGDIIIDGGNSHYPDTERRVVALKEKGIRFLGMGVSGGEEGALNGPSMMPGGDITAWEDMKEILEKMAADDGLGGKCVSYIGEGGSGHFVKMVHNGIEYGIMASYAEGLNILHHANVGETGRKVDAETAPLRNPEDYQFKLDLADITEVWRRGSVIASWLLDLTAHAFLQDPHLDTFKGRVSDSGEGRWTITAAIDESVPAPVLSSALYERFSSRAEAEFADKVCSAMRKEFGGHAERASGG